MRQKRNQQRSIFEVLGKNPGPKELEHMSLFLNANPEILDFAFADLTRRRRTDTGRKGMTADQVLRCAVLKQLRELIYDDLKFWLADSYSQRSFTKIRQNQCPSISTLQSNIKSLREETWMAINLLKKVMDQTERRVLKKEKVPASEKVTSLFETHTHITVKGNRKTEYGHKTFLTGGASNLIIDCLIKRSNPADSDCLKELLDRQLDFYGRPPRQTTADGGFASKENLAYAKQSCAKDAAFSKKRSLSISEMAKSSWVYRKLKKFRDGIEANISTLKRSYGLSRCNWAGWEGFKQYVWSAIVSYNLFVIARLKLATK